LWKVLGTPGLTPEFKQQLADGVREEAAGRSVAQLAEAENEVIVGLLRLRAEHG
jgi:carnitine 3-dehydrogenase